MRIPQIGDIVNCYGKTDFFHKSPLKLVFRALIVDIHKDKSNAGLVWEGIVLYSNERYGYKPLDRWQMGESDVEYINDNSKNNMKWRIE